MKETLSVRPLFCKPTGEGIIYTKNLPALNVPLTFQSLTLGKDLDLVHQWVNMDYTQSYWQMRGSIGLLRSCYQCILQNPYAHSFIGYLDQTPVCQVDIYLAAADELADHLDFDPQDCGFHLMMAPMDRPMHGLTVSLGHAFLEYYFSHSLARRMWAEPDVDNEKSIRLLERLGFEKIKTIQMSYKKAHVYCLTKERWQK